MIVEEAYMAKVIYDYEGDSSKNEHTVKSGEIIEVSPASDDWVGGYINNVFGYIPKQYVVRLDQGMYYWLL